MNHAPTPFIKFSETASNDYKNGFEDGLKAGQMFSKSNHDALLDAAKEAVKFIYEADRLATEKGIALVGITTARINLEKAIQQSGGDRK